MAWGEQVLIAHWISVGVGSLSLGLLWKFGVTDSIQLLNKGAILRKSESKNDFTEHSDLLFHNLIYKSKNDFSNCNFLIFPILLFWIPQTAVRHCLKIEDQECHRVFFLFLFPHSFHTYSHFFNIRSVRDQKQYHITKMTSHLVVILSSKYMWQIHFVISLNIHEYSVKNNVCQVLNNLK